MRISVFEESPLHRPMSHLNIPMAKIAFVTGYGNVYNKRVQTVYSKGTVISSLHYQKNELQGKWLALLN